MAAKITAAPRITVHWREEDKEEEWGNGSPFCHEAFGALRSVTIVNFSSPHHFDFTDGSRLPACDESRCLHLSAIANEFEYEVEGQAWTDIKLSFDLGDACRDELAAMDRDPTIDVVLAPLPIVRAARAAGVGQKARTVRMKDRVKKVAYIHKFCV